MPTLATNLLLIARSPITGRIRNRSAVDKALRAALFAELIAHGRVVDDNGAPAVVDTEPLADHVLATICRAVDARPRVAWRRWHHVVADDRAVLTKNLVAEGRWIRRRDRLGRVRHDDVESDASLALAEVIVQVGQLERAPADSAQATLAVLAVLCGAAVGRPRPRQLRRELLPLLDIVGPVTDPRRRHLQAALDGCAGAIRRRARILA